MYRKILRGGASTELDLVPNICKQIIFIVVSSVCFFVSNSDVSTSLSSVSGVYALVL